jgi:hypothetical protein
MIGVKVLGDPRRYGPENITTDLLSSQYTVTLLEGML